MRKSLYLLTRYSSARPVILDLETCRHLRYRRRIKTEDAGNVLALSPDIAVMRCLLGTQVFGVRDHKYERRSDKKDVCSRTCRPVFCHHAL